MKKLSLLLAVLLLFGICSGIAEETGEFEPSAKLQNSNLYTPLMIDNYDYPIYAYEHESGETVYRVFGKMNGRTGYFEAELLNRDGALTVEIKGDLPRKDARKSAAVALTARRGTFEIPENWNYFYNNANYLQFEDAFGKTQIFLAGYYREGETLLLPCNKKGQPIPGALGVVPESYKNIIKNAPYNYLLPKNMKNGYQIEVYVNTSEGEKVKVKTYRPEFDASELEVSNKLPRMRVRLGTQNANILGLQKMLTDLGYYGGELDGVFGEGCIQALELFQKQNGLRVTGMPDERTMRLLIFGDPVANDKPVEKTNFKENTLGGEDYKNSYVNGN